jgi:dihydrofolate reductase
MALTGQASTWFFATRTFRAIQGQPGGSTGIDDAFASAWEPGIGAEIIGRGKFGPHYGPWPDQEWNGWWGDSPPFHTPVFVLTHHPRPSVQMSGGTSFHFPDASPAQALAQAREAATGGDIRIGGGPATIRSPSGVTHLTLSRRWPQQPGHLPELETEAFSLPGRRHEQAHDKTRPAG